MGFTSICRNHRLSSGLLAFLALMAALVWPLAAAAQYPGAPLKVIIPYPAGSAVDGVARTVLTRMASGLGQPVVFEYKVGAGGNIGMDFVARAPKDGYTLLFTATQLVANPGLGKTGYDALNDFAPIGLVSRIPAMLVVPADSPARSVADLIALVKSRPGAFSFASGGNGGIGHFAGELFKANGGNLDIVHIPYKSAADQVLSVVSGQTALAFPALMLALPQVKAGKLRPLAVTTAKRSALFPDVPTMREAMTPGFTLDAWYGLLAPAGVPVEVVNRLSAELVKALRDPAVRDPLIAGSHEVIGSTPAEFAAVMRDDFKLWGDLATRLGARVD